MHAVKKLELNPGAFLDLDGLAEIQKLAKEAGFPPSAEVKFFSERGTAGVDGRVRRVVIIDGPEVPDDGPHSRSCGIRPHPHGSSCRPDCPTCHGRTPRDD